MSFSWPLHVFGRRPFVLRCLRAFVQEADGFIGVGLRSMKAIVRTRHDPAPMIRQLDDAIHGLDPNLGLADVRTMEQDLSTVIARERFSAWLVGVFAAVAVFLAIVGVSGVVAFAVAQQTSDIGLRIALGAQKTEIMRMILRTSVRLSIWGVGFGLAGAWALAQYMRGLLFDVAPWIR